MGGQYATAVSKVTMVGWLLCEAVGGSPVGSFTQMVLYNDCYALYLPLVSLGRVCLSGSAFRGEVHVGVWDGTPPVLRGSVSRVCFPWVLEIMLSGPRLLLSALALGMCLLGLVVDPPVLSFLCSFSVYPLVSVLLFPWLYLGLWGLLVWRGIASGLVLRGMFVVCSFFCYSWPLGHREASKRVMLEFA